MPFDHEQPALAELPLEAIRIEGRFRREPGDVASLASSIAVNCVRWCPFAPFASAIAFR